MLIPVINRQLMKMLLFNELFLNIYSQLTKHKSLILSTSFFLVCLTVMKQCRVQFSLYCDVNIHFFRRNEINFKPQRQLSEKLIAVSTIGNSIDSVN